MVARDGTPTEITYGDKVDEYFSHNLYLNWQAPWETTVSLSIVNLLDEDPPAAGMFFRDGGHSRFLEPAGSRSLVHCLPMRSGFAGFCRR